MNKMFTIFISILFLATIMGCDTPGGGCGGPGEPDPTEVTVTGPITGGKDVIWSASVVDLDAYGYTEKEYFFEGEATSYKLLGEATEDGKWDIEEAEKAPFKSRMIVRLPSRDKFNGTVIVEWFNVSGGADGDPGFMYTAEEVLREGYAWVGVSAQQVGIEGGGFAMMGDLVKPLVTWDPERYGTLSHPGDAYSYDIFTTAAKIVKGAGSIDVLEGLAPERLIAYGESQSAMMMVSYVDGVHPLAKVFDGFFIHSRGARVMPVGKSREEDIEEESDAAPGCGGGCGSSTDSLFEGAVAAKIRDDLDSDTKVFEFQTEGDVLGETGYQAVRQPDSDTHHCWEITGASHADRHILEMNKNNPMAEGIDLVETCSATANTGPHHQVIKAALHALHGWMVEGTKPPTGDPIQTDAEGNAVLDEYGNALGGIRTPHVDVPIATFKTEMEIVTVDSGCGGGGLSEMICGVFGKTIPLSDEKLNTLYESHDDYIQKVTASANETQGAGFLLAPEVQSIIEDAQAAQIPPKDF